MSRAVIVLSSGDGYGGVSVGLRRGRRWKHPVDGDLTINPLTNAVLKGLGDAGAHIPAEGLSFDVWREGAFDPRAVSRLAARLATVALSEGLVAGGRRRP